MSTIPPKSDSTAMSTSPPRAEYDDTTVDLATAHVHEAIRSLLADEMPDLADAKGLRVFDDPYLQLSVKSFRLYLGFMWVTWTSVLGSVPVLFRGQMSVIDFLALLFFSSLTSVVLTVGVVVCLICKLPLVEYLVGLYSRLNGGYSLVNSINTQMFSSLTKREVAHAKAALSSTAPASGKHFNLEIAKILLLISSVVYERTSESTRASLQATHTLPRVPSSKRQNKGHATNGSTDVIGVGGSVPPSATPTAVNFPVASTSTSMSPSAPPMSNSTTTASSQSAWGSQGSSGQMSSFRASVQALHARAHSVSGLPHVDLPHVPSPGPQMSAFSDSVSHTSSHLVQLFGQSASQIRALLHASPGDSVITKLAGQLGLEYEPVSELNSASSSYAAMFWDKRANWIVLAFKGTTPTEFDEWLTDFDITRVLAGRWVPGYQEIHRGFKARLFPEEETRRRTPYETIMKAVRVVARDLMSRTDKDINLWFTGHSLGCATATLTYTRALLNLDGLDSRIQLCDAYLYGAPVICDITSAKVFNEVMTKSSSGGRVRSLWRVTNRSDAVCTLLPMLGDDPFYPHPTSLFAYAHLGTEVRMRPGSGTSIIVDNYCTQEIQASVVSTRDALYAHAMGDESEGSDVGAEVGFGGGDAVEGYRRMTANDERVGYGVSEGERAALARSGASTVNANTNYGTMESGGMVSKGRKKLVSGVPRWIGWMEYVPLVGRVVSHFPGLYFNSLQQMEPGDFVWLKK